MIEQKQHPGDLYSAFSVSRDSIDGGLSIRMYAAIHLAVPDSGLDWLDDMIRERNRMDDERAAMQGAMSNINRPEWDFIPIPEISVSLAEYLRIQREKRRKG